MKPQKDPLPDISLLRTRAAFDYTANRRPSAAGNVIDRSLAGRRTARARRPTRALSNITMDLFHVSSKELSSGTVIGPYMVTSFALSRASNPQFRLLERRLEELRPLGKTSRLNAVFAFSSPEECSIFWDGERDHGERPTDYEGTPHYYRVSIEEYTRSPVALTDYAFKRLKSGLPYDAIIREYWSPTRNWSCWEFLGNSAVVQSELPLPSDPIAAAARCRHMKDRLAVQDRWPASDGFEVER